MAPAALALVFALGANAALAATQVAGPSVPAQKLENAFNNAGLGELQPHRATYDITLKRASDQSGVDNMSGRMVYEFRGSACSGFSTNFRFVTKIETGGSVSVTDQQVTTFEDVLARRLDFESKSFTDDKMDKQVKGVALLANGAMRVTLSQPEKKELALSAARFPAQHTADILERAHKGVRLYEARLFDGTEDGDKNYLTTTVVGDVIKPMTDKNADKSDEPVKNMAYWPVSIAYYDEDGTSDKSSDEEGDSSGDQLPVYTQSFNLYDNGITRDLTLDYGDVVLKGTLKKLELLDKTACSPAK